MKRSCWDDICLLTAMGAVLVSGCVPPDDSSPPDPSDPPAKAIITTVVGNGLAGENGDGLPGAETALYLPQDVTVGPDGNIYFADWNNHRLRRMVDGVVETVAGTGELGDALDGLALEAQFNHPTNVAFDAEGRLIVAAWHNSKVKRIDLTTGIIENLAGTGARDFGGDGGPGNEAILDLPSSVAVDAIGNILISDQANFRIRFLEPNGTISTICGTGDPGYSGDGERAEEAQLDSPVGQAAPPASRLTLNEAGEIVLADTGNHVIRIIDAAGFIRTVAGTAGEAGYTGDGGPALEAKLNTPSDVAVGPDGSIYIADTLNHVVRVVSPDGTIDTLAGTGERGFDGDGGAADEAMLDRPYGVDVAPDGTVYVADTHNHRIRRITSDLPDDFEPGSGGFDPVDIVECTDQPGSICTYAGTGQKGFNGDGVDRLQSVLYWPMDIEFTPSGRRIVLDWNNHAVREILADDTFTTIMGSYFVGDGPVDLSDLSEPGADPLTVNLNHPTDIQEFANGDILLMAWHNHKLRQIDVETGLVLVIVGAGANYGGDGGPARDALVNQPPHGVLDDNGNLFFIDQRNQRIRMIADFDEQRGNGIITTVAGTGEQGFNGDGPGLDTLLNFPAGGNPEPSGGIAMDERGTLYFSDTQNHRIRKVEFIDGDFASSVVTSIAGTGEAGYGGDGGPAVSAPINYPQDLEIGPDGNLYFADTDNQRIRRIDLATGIIDTVVGTGIQGYSGDGGPAVDAELNRPFGVGFDADGNLYVSDTFNGRIRKVVLEDK